MEETRTLNVSTRMVAAVAAFFAASFIAALPAATHAGIFEGNQNGSLRESLQLEGCYAEALAYGQTDSGDALYLVCNGASAVFVSTDQGATWTGPAEDADYGAPIDVATSSTAGTAYMIAGINLWRTTDAGATWTSIGGNNSNFGQNITAAGSILMATYRSDYQLAYSRDGGDNISYVNVTETDGETVQDMAIGADGTMYALVGTTEGSATLYESADGSTWTSTAKTGEFSVLGTHPTDEDYIVIAGSEGVEYVDAGTSDTWTDMSHPNTDGIERISISPSGSVVVGTYVTTDNGANWSTFAGETLDIRPDFFVADRDLNYYMKTSNGVAKSTDSGSTWTQVIDGIYVATIYDMSITNNKKNIWLAVYGGFVKSNNFKRTTNGRVPTWSSLITPGDASFEATYAVWVHPTNKDVVLAAGDSLHRTTDDGSSWDTVSLGSESGAVVSFGFDATNSKIYAGTNAGKVFVSSDNGENWTDTELAVGTVGSLAVDGQGRVLAGVGDENTTDSANLGVYLYDGSSWSQLSGVSGWVSDLQYVSATKRMYVGVTDSDGMGSVYYSAANKSDWATWKEMKDLPEDMYGPKVAFEDNGLTVYAAYTRPAGTGYIYKCNKNGASCGVFYTGLVDEQFNAILFDDFVSVGNGMYRYESKANIQLKRVTNKNGKVRLRATLKDKATNKKLKQKRLKLYKKKKSSSTYRAVQKKVKTKTNKKGRAHFFVAKAGTYKVRWTPKKGVAKYAYTTRTASTKLKVKKKAVNNAADTASLQ